MILPLHPAAFVISDAWNLIFEPHASISSELGRSLTWPTGGNRESDAGTLKKEAHASTLELELMHEAEKQGDMHHFPAEQLGIHNNRPLCVDCSRHSTLKSGVFSNNYPTNTHEEPFCTFMSGHF